MHCAAKMATFRRVSRRALHYFLALVIAVSTLSAISIVKAPEAAASLTDANCAPTVSGLNTTHKLVGSDCVITVLSRTADVGTWTVPSGVRTANVLLVGGGGAGGTAFNGAGGGGGGGQVNAQPNLEISGVITIQIGAGGTPNGTIGNSTAGGDGGLTFFNRPSPAAGISARGGSGGASVTTDNVGSPKSTGFNGGGGSTWAGTRTFGSAGAAGGFAGGNARQDGSDANFQAGGGGGGASENGFSANLTANPAVGGAGGAGVSNSYGETTQSYGGGGGGGKRTATGLAGAGGNGGGGAGGKFVTGQNARSGDGTNGTNNTGGGGGGAGGEAVGGAGGHGVVIIRYAAPPAFPSNSVFGTATENQTLSLSAPTGQVFTSIVFASYGTSNNYNQSSCHLAPTTQVTNAFLGRNSGSLGVTFSGLGGDPCVGTGKWLSVILLYGPQLSITTPNTGLSATWNTSFTLNLSASGGAGTKSFAVTTGSLPTGLSLNSATGVISGTPSVVGNSAIVVTATDSPYTGTAATSSFTISVAAVIPGQPSITSITPGNTTLSVAFNAPSSNGGVTISKYQYSTDGGLNWRDRGDSGTTATPLLISTTSAATPATLVNGTSYNVQIRAVNTAGNGTPTDSVSGTPRTIASAPTVTSVTSQNNSLSVAFTAPLNEGGAAVSNYKYSLNNGTYTALSPASITSPFVISGLTNGTSYSIKIRAVNAAGDGAESNAITSTPYANCLAPEDKSSAPGYTILKFISTGACNWSVPVGITSIQYLVVAGGGGGGGGINNSHGGGGGGAGGYLTATRGVSPGPHTIFVGVGGSGGAGGGYTPGTAGSPSRITTSSGTVLVEAKGGGGGNTYYADLTAVVDGVGSGGGGAVSNNATRKLGVSGTAGQGKAGGNAATATFAANGGGGGGAGGDGGNGVDGEPCAAGGLGLSSSISGEAITRAIGGAGGNGSTCSSPTSANGAANSGSGGRGGNTNAVGGDGGSGVVIVRYANGEAAAAAIETQPVGAASGALLATQPVVRIVDANGNIIASSTVSVVASIASGGGTLSGTTSVQAVNGVATFTDLAITGASGNRTLTFTPTSLTAVTSSAITISAGAANKVAITRASIGTQRRTAFTTQPQITVQDSSGNTVTSSPAEVTATVSAGGTLVGTTTATASSGVATFTGLGVDGTIGTTYTITYTVSGLTVATATVTLTGTTCDGSFTCQVGDTGPGGGIIFYVAPTFFTQTGATGSMCTTNCKYLEAAPTSGSNAWTDTGYVWSGNTNTALAASSTSIGGGFRNTAFIVSQTNGSTANRAGTISRAYRGPNNLDDWFLPSRDELNQMCKWQKGITGDDLSNLLTVCTGTGLNLGSGAAGFSGADYWSSSNSTATLAWIQSFANGLRNQNNLKSNSALVRPIRAFGPAPIVISEAAIAGVTAPVAGATPVTTTTAGTGYTGTVTWSGSPTTFATGTTYTATITLTAAAGYTLTGVTANFFTVAGATTDTNSANSGVVTAVFPATASSNIATLSGLTLSNSAALSSTFDPAVTSYAVSVANSVATGFTITPATTQANATTAQFLGAEGTTAFTGALAVGANVIRVVVTAQDGNTKVTYTVTVTRAVATYVITLAAGTNGTGSNQTLTKTNGVNLTLPDSATANGYFTRTGYSVTGWSTTNLGSQTHALGGAFTTEAITTLYPVWTGNTLTVTLDEKGGTPVADASVTVGATLSEPTPPTKAGSYLLGWSTTDGGVTVSFPYTHNQTANFTLYAIWTVGVYSTNLRVNLDATNRNSLAAGSPTSWSSIAPGSSFASILRRGTFAPGSTPGAFNSIADSFVSFGHQTAARITGDITVETWLKLDANYQVSSTDREVANHWINHATDQKDVGSMDWYLRIVNGRLTLFTSNLQGVETAVQSGAVITNSLAGKWIQIGFTQLANGSVQFFLNGAPTGSALSANARRGSTTARLLIGNGSSSFIGSMSKFRMYAEALTSSQIRSNYNLEAAGFSRLEIRDLTIDSGSYSDSYAATATAPTITSTASAGTGTKTYSSSTTLVCTIDAATGVVAFVTAGTCTVSASIAADETYDAATSASVSFTVTLATRTISIDSSSYSSTYAATATPPTITSTASAGTGTKTYSSSTTLVCTIDTATGVVVFVTAGTCTLAVSIAASATHAVATSSSISFTVSLTTQTVTWSPTLSILATASPLTPNALASALGSAAITYTVQSPGATGCTVNASTAVLTFTAPGTCTVRATAGATSSYAAATADATFTITAAALSDSSTPTAAATPGVLKSIAVTWTAVANASSYTLKLYATNGTTVLATITGLSGTSRTITASDYLSLADSTAYKVSITAIGTGNYSSSNESSQASVTTASGYTLTYSYDGATSGNTDATTSFITGATAITLPVPGKTGYTFDGWYEASELSGTKLSATYTPTQTRTIHAKWIANTLTVTFNSQEGNVVNASSVATNAKLTAPTAPTRAGYTFTGWSTTSAGSVISFTGGGYTHGQTASFELFAIWSANSLTVTFNSQEGTVVNAGSVATNAKLTAPTAPTRAGYTFSGWSTTSAGSVISFTGGYTHGQTANFTLFAIWSADTLTVTYNAQGGSAVTAGSVATDAKIANAPTAPTRAGYTFTGWSTTSAGSVISFTGGYTHGQTANFTLFAIWSANSLNVAFDSKSGSLVSSTTVNTGASISAAPTAPTRSGYSFAGWSATDGGTAVTFPYAHGQTADFTLYAIWNAGSLVVTYDSKGGSLVSSGAVNTGASISAAPTAPTRAGYTFGGWSATDGGTAVNFPYAHGQTTSFTLYAKWAANSLTITYDSKGGSSVASGSTITDGSISVAPTAPTKANFTFAGWSATDGGTAITFPFTHEKTANFPLYALWTANAYVLTYVYNSADGGTRPANANFTTGGSPIVLPTPTRTGYTFDGWHSDITLTSSIGAAGANYSPTGSSLTPSAFAKWVANNYQVTYSAVTRTGGSVPTDLTNYNIGQNVVIKGNSGSLVRTGYTFAGWTFASDGTGDLLNSGSTYVTQSANMIFYAKWSANTYTITFNKNGGSGAPANPSTTYTTAGAQVNLTTAPGSTSGLTKTGFDLSGWSESPTGSIISTGYTTTADVTLYAIWTLKSISITFSRGIAVSPAVVNNFPSNTSLTYGSTLTLAGNVTSTVVIGGAAHAFVGWTHGGTIYRGGDTFLIGETAPTFVAEWVKIFAVRYAMNGGTAASSSSEVDAECTFVDGSDLRCLENQDITTNAAPSRAGYTFAGWTNQGGTAVPTAGITKITTTNYLFYANWTAINYAIAYNTAGGSDAPSEAPKQIGQTFALAAAPTRTGYNFAGWSDGNSVFGAGVTYIVGTSPVNFTAQWTPKIYTVIYDWNGGVGTPTPNDSYTVATTALTLPVVGNRVKDGYTFSGWSTSENGTLISGGFTPTADTTLYAIWGTGSYTLTYDANGGTVGTTSAAVQNGNTLTLPTPTRSNFVFEGWFSALTGGVSIGAAGTSFQPAQSRTVYARWTQSSLYGLAPSALTRIGTVTASATDQTTFTNSNANSSVTVVIPAGALPAGTTVNFDRVGDLSRAQNAIAGNNNYIISIVVSWITSAGTVPDTATGTALSVTISNSSIKAGAVVYAIVAGSVEQLGTATQNGTVTVALRKDPEVVVVATKPNAPTNLAVTSASGQAALTWTAPSTDGGSEITGYTVSGTGGVGCSTTVTSCTITGLTAGASYTYTVTATNAIGTSELSTSVSAISVTRPGSPTAVQASANGTRQSVISWTAPTSDGGSSITGYTATANGGATCTTTSTSCTITGLADGTTYSFTVVATNLIGSSDASASVNARTANAPVSSGGDSGGNSSGNNNPGTSAPAPGNVTTVAPVTVVGDKDAKVIAVDIATPTLGSNAKPAEIKVDRASEQIIAEVKVVDGKLVLTPEKGFSGRRTVTVTVTENGADRIIQIPLTVLPEAVTKPVLTPTASNRSVIRWTESPNANGYTVLLNGKRVCTTTALSCSVKTILGPNADIEIISNGGDRTVSQRVDAEFRQNIPVAVTRLVSATITKATLTRVDTRALDKVVALIRNQGFGTVVISEITTTSKTRALAAARIESIKKYIASKIGTEEISFEVTPVTTRTTFNNISVKG